MVGAYFRYPRVITVPNNIEGLLIDGRDLNLNDDDDGGGVKPSALALAVRRTQVRGPYVMINMSCIYVLERR